MEEKNKEKELILCSLLDAALHAEPHVENQAALKQKWERLKQQETDWESILSIADRHRVLPLLYDVLENILPEDGAAKAKCELSLSPPEKKLRMKFTISE